MLWYLDLDPLIPLWSAAEPISKSLFQLDLPLAEKIIRPILVYLFLVVLLRIFGKRELAQLNPFDLVVLLSLSNTVQNAIIGEDNSVTGGLVGAFALCAINYGVVRFLFRHRRLDQIIEGRSTVLMKDGQIRPKAMGRELITKPELLSVVHRQGFGSLEEIDHITLEPGGTFAIEAKQPREGARLQAEVLERLDALTKELSALRAELAGRGASPPTGN